MKYAVHLLDSQPLPYAALSWLQENGTDNGLQQISVAKSPPVKHSSSTAMDSPYKDSNESGPSRYSQLRAHEQQKIVCAITFFAVSIPIPPPSPNLHDQTHHPLPPIPKMVLEGVKVIVSDLMNFHMSQQNYAAGVG